MKVLVIGSGGRENALAWKIAQNPKVEKIFLAPGNGGLFPKFENVDIPVDALEELSIFAEREGIDWTIVGPELPLVQGIVDHFKARGLKIFGPHQRAARLEGSKAFAKEFMLRYEIPTAKYSEHTQAQEAIEQLEGFSLPVVIKADGLCAGKGVIIAQTRAEAETAIREILEEKKFGEEGKRLVIEEYLDGRELSLICVVSGNRLFPLETAKDYKRIGEGDQGLNTGGVGCYSPVMSFSKSLEDRIREEVLKKIEIGLAQERIEYCGVLFIGFMVVEKRPYVLEFNVRFGDPETEVLMPRLQSDLMEIVQKASDGTLSEKDISWEDQHCLTVILCSEGYPESYEKGKEIHLPKLSEKQAVIFHNGTELRGDMLYTSGGRVLSVTAWGEDREEVRKRAYHISEEIRFEGKYYRTDIGK